MGDGEAEIGAVAAVWHCNKFVNPGLDGAVLPVLRLNGCQIANPTALARFSDATLTQLFSGYGYKPYFVEGYEPQNWNQLMASAFEIVLQEICDIQNSARSGQSTEIPVWPMIVLRRPKGWTGLKTVDGKPVENRAAGDIRYLR